MGTDLVPGRECGACVACCVALSIDDPLLRKPAGIACAQCGPGGCAIYEARPEVCRRFQCGWRRLPFLGDDLRPDRSGVLVRVVQGADGCGNVLEFVMLDRSKLGRPGLAEAIGAAVQARIVSYLVLPGAVDAPATRRLLNAVLERPVGRRDRAAVMRALTRLAQPDRAAR
jgi:hypothetical protein